MSETTQAQQPQHLHLITSGLRWDWRRENPAEVVIVVFALMLFFLMPRGGCGITQPGAKAKATMGAASAAYTKLPPKPVKPSK